MRTPMSETGATDAGDLASARILPKDVALLGIAAERVNRGFLVFDADARVLACNAAAWRTLRAQPDLLLVPMAGPPGGALRLRAQPPGLQGDIEQAVHDCACADRVPGPFGPARDDVQRPARILQLARHAGRPALMLHLSRLNGGPADPQRDRPVPAVLGTLIDRGRPLQLDARLLGELFDLSAASARVAEAYLRVDSVKDAARALGISVNTVKTHLAAVYERTGCTRQSQLVRLLMSLADSDAL
jgi:DNA-binding CsgD family transcriptional regulator